MATAQDFAAIGSGLDSITQAVLGNFMARRAREQQEEEKRRFDQQRADQLAAEVAMRQLRERQLKLAEDQAKAQADYRAGQVARQNRLDTERKQGQAEAAAQQSAFNNLAMGGEVAPQATSQFEHLNPTGEAQPLNAEGLGKAAAAAGILTPELARGLVSMTMQEKALSAKGGREPFRPVPYRFTLANGQTVDGYMESPNQFKAVVNGQEIVAHAILGPDKKPVPNLLNINGQVERIKAEPLPDGKAIAAELQAIADWERDNPPDVRRGEGAAELANYYAARKRILMQQGLNAARTQPSAPPAAAGQAAPAPAAPAPAADYNYVPGVGLQRPGAPAVAPAPTPPDVREQDAAPVAPPVAPQPPKPEPALRLSGFNRPAEVTPTPSRAGYTAERRTADRVAAITQELTAARTRLAEAQSGKKGAFMDRSAQAKLVDQAEKLFAELVQINPEAARQFAQ